MSSDRELTHIVRSWLEEGVNVLPDRVLDDVLAELPMTSQRRPMGRAWRKNLMNKTLKFAAAGVVALVVAVAGLALYFNRPAVMPAGSPTPAQSPSITATAPTDSTTSTPALVTQPTDPGADKAPWVVFLRGDGRFGTADDLWAMRVDGSDAVKIFGGLMFPNIAWSQDGSRLLVADSDANGISHVYLAEVSDVIGEFVDTGFGTGAETACNERSRQPAPCQDYQFSFAPDGEHAVFKQRCTYFIPGCEFFTVLDLRTGERTEPAVTIELGRNLRPLGDPVWSPDGSMIAFVRETDVGDQEVAPESNLYVMNADGTSLRKIELPVPRVTAPQWSPDGSTIAVASDVFIEDHGTGANIYTVRVDGTDPQQLTTDNLSSFPEWTSSGRIRFRHGNDSLPTMTFSLMDADGGNVTEFLDMERVLGAIDPIGPDGTEYVTPGYLWQPFLWQPSE